MSVQHAPAASEHERSSALLLVNTGTPNVPRSFAVRAFLRRFLSDPRVIELPRALWLPLLYLLVLPLRAPRSAARYRLIWQREGSPLAVNTAQLTQALAQELAARGLGLRVERSFLYSQPLVGEVMDTLRRSGVQRLAVLPLFPQSSGSTTGAVYDQVAASLRPWRTLPELRCIAGYHAEPHYIRALSESVRAHWREHGRDGLLLVSFHGIPQSYAQRGDRYPEQCRETATLLASALELTPEQWSLSFQSRFGANRWLTPATDATLRELPSRGVRAVTVICPGFAADCLETLEEIALAGRAHFLAAGGERFSYVPALNAQSAHVSALAELIERTLADWR
jgi:protoporphyrin/coproporphyrin ferrochelatase